MNPLLHSIYVQTTWNNTDNTLQMKAWHRAI